MLQVSEGNHHLIQSGGTVLDQSLTLEAFVVDFVNTPSITTHNVEPKKITYCPLSAR